MSCYIAHNATDYRIKKQRCAQCVRESSYGNRVYEDMVVLSNAQRTEANVLSTILSNAEIAFHSKRQEIGILLIFHQKDQIAVW